eukprot:1139723-Pelagomonas_calceolata.AAC.1
MAMRCERSQSCSQGTVEQNILAQKSREFPPPEGRQAGQLYKPFLSFPSTRRRGGREFVANAFHGTSNGNLPLNKCPRAHIRTSSTCALRMHAHGCVQDREKTAWVNPNTGVKRGCLFYPLLFSLYFNDIDEIAEGVQGAVTGTAEFFAIT